MNCEGSVKRVTLCVQPVEGRTRKFRNQAIFTPFADPRASRLGLRYPPEAVLLCTKPKVAYLSAVAVG
jgi:hypothetical protein